MLVEKEVISPGTYWYVDQATDLPRKWTVTADTTKQLHRDGNEMLALGLPVPVPFEHDFTAHPMTPKEKLLNNAGQVKEYRLRGDTLWSVVDVQDEDAKKKVGRSIRWTSPWITSFTDGGGRQWNNVIGHLALTTRPRVTKQAPFQSVAAALSLATDQPPTPQVKDGICTSRALRLVVRKRDGKLRPQYPMAFSIIAGGIHLADDPAGAKKPPKPMVDDDEDMAALADDGDAAPDPAAAGDGVGGDADLAGLMDPMQDSGGDVKMEELLCDLLQALGVPMPDESNENEFKRHLYEAAMSKIKELTSKGMGGAGAPDQNQPPTQQPNASQPSNPLIQQEQQPMYMSLEEINKIADPAMRGIALAMYNENAKLRAEADADRKKLNSLNDAKLREENTKRASRIQLLGKLSPRVKADLDAMLALPSMALSMGDGGAVVDPMAQTLAVLEKGLADIPRLLTTPSHEVIAMAQPTDGEMSTEMVDKLADDMARMMGCPPEVKKSA